MIYLKLEKEPNSIKELLSELFNYKRTLFDGNISYTSVETYFDKEYTQLECNENKYRSVDNIVEIVQTYFPDAGEKEIFENLIGLVLNKEDKNYYIVTVNCYDIYKPTVYFAKTPYHFSMFNDDGMPNSKYRNWAKVCSFIGINSMEELRNFTKELMRQNG